MWQSKMSRSTGWHRPAVPPFESASQPGEKTSEQPSGKCGCCGVGFCCSATTSCLRSGSTASMMRCALRLMGFKCVIVISVWREPSASEWPQALSGRRSAESLALQYSLRFHFVPIESFQKRPIALRELAVDAQARVGPAADPLTVMKVRLAGRAVADVRLVVTAPRAERPRPAAAAICLVRDVVIREKRRLRPAIDAVADR